MQHRLFHTLVISSSMLLEACASTHGSAMPDASMPTDAPTTPDAFVSPDADPRTCEPGWPTTKGNFSHTQAGLAYNCPSGARDGFDGPVDLTRCCISGRAEE